jgi:hypothetical protein
MNNSRKEYKRHNEVPRMEKICRKRQNMTKTCDKARENARKIARDNGKPKNCAAQEKRTRFLSCRVPIRTPVATSAFSKTTRV